MKFAHIKEIRGSRSLYGSFLYIALVPLFIFGIVIMIYSSYTMTVNIKKEASDNLRNVGVAVLAAYEAAYKGDYNVVITDGVVEFYKGDVLLSEDFGLIDNIKSDTGVEISLFFYDTRVLTTITDPEGNRMINKGVNTTVLNTVVNNRTDCFYDNVLIGGKRYFAYYMPIMSWDGLTCLGMIGTATPANEVEGMVKNSVIRNLLIMLLALFVTAWFILHYTSGLISIIKRIMVFLQNIADGDLSVVADPVVIQRKDELGEMGRLAVRLRGSLRKLIEKDALTGINNRRYGRNKLNDLVEKGISYSIAMGDIDYFKQFNDKYGHDCGDKVLIEVARILSEGMRGKGFATRWGGEEFLLVFDNMKGMAATLATEKILDSVREQLVEHDGTYLSVTMSFGVAQADPTLTIDQNIDIADTRLYQAKEGGRNQIVGE
ncbi:MAG: diguanylate cyclase [Lachnospiraceae bacterium]|nr:diguanylate cyclase [Lachnospiraceae bacterium]